MIPLRFDITAALPDHVTQGHVVSIAAWLFLPPKLPQRTRMMVLTSGGSYDKRYHHAVIPDHPGYSAAEHLAGLGNIVLLADHLGTGESTWVPEQRRATRQIVALANHAAVLQFHDRLAAGDLLPDLVPIPNAIRIGGGHSMGAMLTVIQQAEHRTYDAIMVMGYTAQGVHFTLGGQKARAADYMPRGELPDYTRNDRAAQRQNFHWNDVPEAVMLADDAMAVETPSMIGLDSIRTNIITREAAMIDVPVFLGLGERDVSPDPDAEAACFARCPHFAHFTLPRSAHCQTFASTRHQFWDAMDEWACGLDQA